MGRGREHQLPVFIYRPVDQQGVQRNGVRVLRRKIRATVKDPKTAELLCPNDHPIGTKRLILDTDYYETYNRDNVTLIDIRSKPLKEITPTGLRTTDADYALDAIVFATGSQISL
jgi:cyclohexanone monooxygenase